MIPKVREMADRKRCPCEFPEVGPCKKTCSCWTPHFSGGCRRCATYGSYEQQVNAAVAIAIALDGTAERSKP